MTLSEGGRHEFSVGSLFTGIAGLDLAAQWAGFSVAWQSDINVWALGHCARNFPGARQHCIDVRDLRGHDLEPVDVVCGGPPCQPFSDAGNKRGKADDRYLWPEMYRVIRELDPQPRAVVFENVPGIRNMVLREILTDLESAGYSQQFCFRVPLAALGATNIRYRIFVVAYTEIAGTPAAEQRGFWDGTEQGVSTGTVADSADARLSTWQQSRFGSDATQGSAGVVRKSERCGVALGNTDGQRRQGIGALWEQVASTRHIEGKPESSSHNGGFEWATQPRLGIAADGLPAWVVEPHWPAWRGQPQHDWEQSRTVTGNTVEDRAKQVEAIGNAVSPVHAYPLWIALRYALGEQAVTA